MLYGDPDFIANLSFQGFEESSAKVRRRSTHTSRGSNSRQHDLQREAHILFTGVGVERGYGYLPEIDLENRALTMRWRERHEEAGGLPSVLTFDDYVGPMEKPGVCSIWRNRSSTRIPRSTESGLDGVARSRAPRFIRGFGPESGLFSDDSRARCDGRRTR